MNILSGKCPICNDNVDSGGRCYNCRYDPISKLIVIANMNDYYKTDISPFDPKKNYSSDITNNKIIKNYKKYM